MENIRLSVIDARCAALTDDLEKNAAAYGVSVETLPSGAVVVDAGIDAIGSFDAGARMTELCQGGLGRASVQLADLGGVMLPHISLETNLPRLAALTMQSAAAFQKEMLSGPIKLYLDDAADVERDIEPACARGSLTAILQTEKLPSDAWACALAKAAGCAAERLTLICARQESLAGSAQICGRMNENVLFTMERSLGLDSRMVRSILGVSPICPATKALLPDDFLHYAASAYLVIDAPGGLSVEKLAHDLTFASTDIFGALFSDLLAAAGGDFFKIPNLLHINIHSAADRQRHK